MQRFLGCCLPGLLFLFISCQDVKTARFVVHNKSSAIIDSLYFMPGDTGSRLYLRLDPGEKQRYHLSLAGESNDGAYAVYFRKGGENVGEGFGYFSNGAAMEKYTVVEIWDDTLVIKQKY